MPVWVHDKNGKGLYLSSERLLAICKEHKIPVYFDHDFYEQYIPTKYIIKFLTVATANITMITVEQHLF